MRFLFKTWLSLMTGFSLFLLLGVQVSRAAAQDDPLRMFYAITQNATDETQSILEIDASSGQVGSVFTISTSSEGVLKDVLPPDEIKSLEEAVAAGDVTTINAETVGVEHSIEGVWQLDSGTLLMLLSTWRCDTPLSGCFGEYTFNRITLTEGEPHHLVDVAYHQPLPVITEPCAYEGTYISVVIPHPTTTQFAFTRRSRSACFAATSTIVEYANDPTSITEMPNTDSLAWSPDGASLAYITHDTCSDEGCAASLFLQSESDEPVLVKETTLVNDSSFALAWMDAQTLIYSLTDEEGVPHLVWYDTFTQKETESSADADLIPEHLYTLENSASNLLGVGDEGAAVGLPAQVDADLITDFSSVSDVIYNSKYNDYLFANFDGQEVLVIDAALEQTRVQVADFLADMPDEELINLAPGAAAPVYECTVEDIATEKALIKEIEAANEGDTAAVLCLTPGTTLTLTTLTAPNSDSGDNHLPVILGDITLIGYGSTLMPEEGELGRLARVKGTNARLTLIDLTLSGWHASEKSDGGVFRVDEGTLTIQNSTLTENAARRGGVIFNNQGAIVIENSTFSNNSATQTGGVLDSVGTLSITDSILSHNAATAGGGGLYLYNLAENPTYATLTRVTLLDDSAEQDGGALYFAATDAEGANGTLTIENSRIEQSIAAGHGGALYLAAGTTTLTNTLFDSNAVISEASSGGAIYIIGLNTLLNATDTTFQKSLATARGGALYADHSPVTITGGAFTDNQTSAEDGDGGAIFALGDEETDHTLLTIEGTQFIGNTASDQGGAIALSFVEGHITGSCLARNAAQSGAGIWSNAPLFKADDNWWEAVPLVNSNVTAEKLLDTCPVADLEPQPLIVTSFKLIDAESDKAIKALIDGDQIDLRTMPGITLRIGVNTEPLETGSVVFELNDEIYSTDNTPEYRLAASWPAEPGVYRIKATPYTGPDGSGIMGTPMILTFTILDYVISEPVMSNGKTYTRATLTEGQLIYKDRDYVITDADETFLGRDFIQAVNNDKELAEPNFMTFDLLCDATIYIGYDTRLPEPPWLTGWSLTNSILIASDTTGSPIRTMYMRDFSAGTVVLGSNYGVTDSYTYTVIAVPHDECHSSE